LVRSMDAAQKAGSPAADAFKELGINVKDADGNLRNTQDVFMDVIGSLGKIENEAERDAIAMSLFGRSAQELNPLIKAGTKGIEAMRKEAHRLGIVLDEEALTAAADFNDKLGSLKAGLGGIGMQIGSAVIPILSKLIDKYLIPAIPIIQEVAKGFGAFITVLGEGDIGGAFDALTEFLDNVGIKAPFLSDIGDTIEIIFEKIQEFATQAAPIVQEVFAFIAEHAEAFKAALIGIGVVLAASGIIAAIVGIIAAINPVSLVIAGLIGAVALLSAAWTENWGGIRDTLTNLWEGTLRPALESLWNWLQINIPLAIDWLKTKWEELKVKTAEVWVWVQENVLPILTDVYNWIQTNLPLAIDWLKTKWEELKVKLDEIWKWVQENLITLFKDIQEWLDTNIPKAIDFLKTKWEELKVKLDEVWKWVQENVFKTLDDLRTKIETDLPAAIDTLKMKAGELKDSLAEVRDYIVNDLLPKLVELKSSLDTDITKAAGDVALVFNTLLTPAFKEYVIFLSEHVLPLLESVNNLLVTMGNIVQAVAGFWGQLFLGTIITVYNFISEKVLGILDDLGLRALTTGEKASIAQRALDGFRNVLKLIGGVIDWLKIKIDDLARWLQDLANKIPDLFKPGSPSPFETALTGIGSGAILAAKGVQMLVAAFELLGKTTKKIHFAQVAEMFNIAGTFSALGGAASSRYQKKVVDPLSDQLEALDDAIEAQRVLIDESGAIPWMERLEMMRELERMEARRVLLAEEYAKAQEHITALQKQQEDLAFLKTQMDFLKLIKDEGLDIGEILGSLKLGLDTDLPSLMDAMARAIKALIDKAQEELQIGSPSKRFIAFGQNIMGSLSKGIMQLSALPQRAMVSALTPIMTPALQPITTNASYRNMTVNMNNTISNGMDQDVFEARVEQVLARVMGG